jgi:hypothetical protein
MKNNSVLIKKKYSISANKTFFISVIFGLLSMVLFGLVKYVLNYDFYTYIDLVTFGLFLLSMSIFKLFTKITLISMGKYYFTFFIFINILLGIIYMLSFVDDFSSIVVGLSYVFNIIITIIFAFIFGKKYNCIDEILDKKDK